MNKFLVQYLTYNTENGKIYGLCGKAGTAKEMFPNENRYAEAMITKADYAVALKVLNAMSLIGFILTRVEGKDAVRLVD